MENENGGNASLRHDGQGIARHRTDFENSWPRRHHVFGTQGSERDAASADVAICDHTVQPPMAIDHAGNAKALLADDLQHFFHGRLAAHEGQGLTAMHEALHPHEIEPQATAGMQLQQIGRLDSAHLHQSDRQCVAERKHHRGRGGRRAAEWTGFGFHWEQEVHRGTVRDGRPRTRGDGDDRDAETVGPAHNDAELACVTGIREDDQRVAPHQASEFAMNCIAGVHKSCRRAGRSQRRCDFLPDLTGFSEAAGNDPTRRPPQDRDRVHETLANVMGERP
ncbi:hypothetical protein D9M73_131290 [compost metagenome]